MCCRGRRAFWWLIVYPVLILPVQLVTTILLGLKNWLLESWGILRASDSLGTQGERAVARFLSRQGYVVLGQNVVLAGGEIDIVAQHGHTLVFVEVKTRTVGTGYDPIAAVDRKKRRQLMKLGTFYWRRHRAELRRYRVRRYRFDIVGVYRDERMEPTALRRIGVRRFKMKHWQNVVFE